MFVPLCTLARSLSASTLSRFARPQVHRNLIRTASVQYQDTVRKCHQSKHHLQSANLSHCNFIKPKRLFSVKSTTIEPARSNKIKVSCLCLHTVASVVIVNKIFQEQLKFELAERIAGKSSVHEQALESVFVGVMSGIKETAKIEFEPSLKQRIWNKVSKSRLDSLKEFLLLKYCEKILGTFGNTELEEMLEEHKRTGYVKNDIYKAQLQIAYYFHHLHIIYAVVEKANSMTKDWIPEIVQAVREEGIVLSKPE